MKVFIEPRTPRTPDKADGGIRRVITAMEKYLPQFGVKVTRKIEDADLTAGHVDHAPIVQGKPFVSHNHGLMWSEYFDGDVEREINQNVVAAMLQADAITTPSHWVRDALVRGMLRTPKVIYHGVDLDEWQVPSEHGNYVLWNKARADAVSNPQNLMTLAEQMPKTQFVSTLGTPSKNMRLCGVTNYAQMKSIIANAGVYLATARETFGIGTLEALACGVPVAGWDYGGQSEIIIQGETGYLAPHGDYAALQDCVNKCFAERARLSRNARADVEKRWQWQDKIEQYANLYKAVYLEWNVPQPKVSVIVPCHNLAKYLPNALKSIAAQTMQEFECIIVDDASVDSTLNLAITWHAWNEKKFHYIHSAENVKLSRALNLGHARARGRYVMNLDADNVLPENALEILSDALDKRRDLHVVYGALDTMSDDGTNRQRNQFPYPVYENFSWNAQLAHLNQLPSSAMMRREVVTQSNGWRERQWRAEDAEFWCRVSSFGFKIERVTDQPTLIYRWRAGSKSMIERRDNPDIDGDWCEYFPYRTARNADEGRKAIAKDAQAVANPHLVPFGAQGKRTDKLFWDVSHHQSPLVSVVIPVGQGHKRYLNDALDSLIGQTMQEWEAIIINDTGDDWDKVEGAPYAKVFKTKGKQGAGAARNLGLDHARGKLVFFLDADDMLKPDALVKMTQRFARGDCGYVYCDALVPESQTKNAVHEAGEFTQTFWAKNWLHSQAVLMTKADALKFKFDETMPALEDLDFFIRLAIAGICGGYVPEPLLLYRKHLGQRSAWGFDHKEELVKQLQLKYQDYRTGAKPMARCGSCGDKKVIASITQSKVMQMKVETLDKPLAPGFVRLKYTGAKSAPVHYYANGHPYPAANTPKWKFLDVPEKDASVLLGMQCFERVRIAPMVAPVPTIAPAPIPVTTPIAEPTTQPVPTKPIPRTVDETAMQSAIVAMEKATGQPIQPKPKEIVTVPEIPAIPVEPVSPKKTRTYKARRK